MWCGTPFTLTAQLEAGRGRRRRVREIWVPGAAMEILCRVCVVLVVACGLAAETGGVLLALDLEDIRGLDWRQDVNGSFPELVLDILAPVSAPEGSVGCLEDSGLYKAAANGDESWAMTMMDASSLIPGSQLVGNRIHLGNYDECLSVEGVESVSGNFSGQHCMVTTGSINATHPSRWAVCIPSSCTPRDLQVHLRTALAGLIGDSVVTVGESACKSREQPPTLTVGDWFVIVFLGLLAVVVALSTAYDLMKPTSEPRSALLVCFSIPANCSKFLEPATDRDTLTTLHGIRALAMLLVVLDHSSKYLEATPRMSELPQGLLPMICYHLSSLSVDTFFIVSGLLVCYSFMRGVEGGRRFNLPLLYLHRYIRLTPAFALMMLLSATVFGNVGEGPLWQENVITEGQHCQDNWWLGLIYLNNYINPHEACLKHSWYLSANMQLFFLSPIVLYLIRKWPKIWKILIGALILVGVLISFPWNWLDFPDGQWLALRMRIATHIRLTPWVIGMGLGYVLHTDKDAPANMSQCKTTVGWVLSVLGFLVSSLMLILTNDISGWLPRPFWSFSVSWVIYACEKGYGGAVTRFLSWKVFQILDRLSYGVYLVHLPIAVMLIGSTRTPIHLNCTSYVMQFSSILVVSLLAALVLYLVCEAPALAFEKSLLGKAGLAGGKKASYNVEDGAAPRTADGIKLDTIDFPYIDEDRKLYDE